MNLESLNSLWVKWLIGWCWRQNWKFPTKLARREIYLPAPTVWLCLYQICLWKTEGIWLYTVANCMVCKIGPVALIVLCKLGLFLLVSSCLLLQAVHTLYHFTVHHTS